MEFFFNETIYQVNKNDDQWSEIQKLINIFYQEIPKGLKIISS